MHPEHNAADFFNGFAETFDSIYDGKRNRFMRWIDCTFRSDMFLRYTLTFDSLGDIRGGTILDIGCGSGPYVLESLKRGAGRVTAVDPASNMLSLTRKRLEQSGLTQQCTFVQATFPDANFEVHDHAIVMGVMDYVADAAPFLSSLRPLVRRSAVLSFPSEHWFRTPFRQFRYRLRHCPVYFYDEPRITKLCSKAGFRHINIRKIPGAGMDYHVCLQP